MKMNKITKKGFTLAEVLIVLMVIGALATMLLPSLLKGVNEAQWKTAYKKAYNAIANLCAMEKVSGALPADANDKGQQQMFSSMSKSLSVKDYLPYDKSDESGEVPSVAEYKPCTSYKDMSTAQNTVCDGADYITFQDGSVGVYSPWIITDDNISYSIIAPSGGECKTKEYINSKKKLDDAYKASCVVLLVDVNGLSNGPNKPETQLGTDLSSAAMKTLTGDRFYIFIGSDGATAGNKSALVTGRIAADLK